MDNTMSLCSATSKDIPAVNQKIWENSVKFCQNIKEYNSYTSDAAFFLPFILNGVGVLSMEFAIMPFPIACIIYEVAKITLQTNEIFKSKMILKNMKHIKEKFKQDNINADYIMEQNTMDKTVLKIDKKMIKRKEKFLKSALMDKDIKPITREKMRKEFIKVREYKLIKDIKKINKRRVKKAKIQISYESIKIVGDFLMCNLPLWIYGGGIKLLATASEIMYKTSKKVRQLGRDLGAGKPKGSIYRKIFNIKKNTEEKYKKYYEDVEILKELKEDLKSERDEFKLKYKREKYLKYLESYGNNIDKFYINKSNKLKKSDTNRFDIWEKIFLVYGDQLFDMIYICGDTLEERERITKPVSQFMQRGFLVGMFLKEIVALRQEVSKIKKTQEELKKIIQIVKHDKNLKTNKMKKEEKEFIRFLEFKNEAKKRFVLKLIGFNALRICGDVSRFVSCFNLIVLNIVGLSLKLGVSCTELIEKIKYDKIIKKNNKLNKNASKYTALIMGLFEELDELKNNEARWNFADSKLKIYIESMDGDYEAIKNISDIENKTDYIRQIISNLK